VASLVADSGPNLISAVERTHEPSRHRNHRTTARDPERGDFSGGIAVARSQPEAARALLAYLASPAAADIKLRYGMHPA
jgi:hypothetical protein